MKKEKLLKFIKKLFDSEIHAECEDPYCEADIIGKKEFFSKLEKYLYDNK